MKIHHHPSLPPAAPKAPPAPQSHASPAATTAKHSSPKQTPGPKMPRLGHSTRDTFDRLDRNNNHRIDMSDLVGGSKVPKNPGTIRGDTNHDGSVSFKEFQALQKHAQAPKKEGSSKGKPEGTHPLHSTFTLPKGDSATFRTHPQGLVLGRVQAGDKFVASQQKGNWVYGHVAGHPDRKGWVLRESLPKHSRESTPHERAEGTRHSEDLRKKAGLDYTTGKDKQAMQYMQQDLHVSNGKMGYTTPVRPKDASKPITVYANYPCTAANVLKGHDGKPMQIPAGQDVKFRYTPDGKNAVVLLGSSKKGQGTWGIVPLNQLDIPQGTLGAATPPRPIQHVIRG